MKTPRSIFAQVCWLAFFASVARAAEPKNRPILPNLVVGSESSKSFVVEGVYRPGVKGRIGFQVVCEGEKQLTTMFDHADGVPLLISDGTRTLVYDFGNDRILVIAKGFVNVGFTLNEEKTAYRFQMGVKPRSKDKTLTVESPRFRLNEMLESYGDFETETATNGTVTYTSNTEPALIVQFNPSKRDSYNFMQPGREEGSEGIEIAARLINQPIPAELLNFPDLKQFPKELKVAEYQYIDEQPELNHYFYAKLMLLCQPEEEDWQKYFPDHDIDKLRKRDEQFGKIYRKALAEQGIVLREFPNPAAGKKDAKSK